MWWKRVLLGLLVAVNCLLAWRLLAGEQGLFAYLELRRSHARMQERLDQADSRARDLSDAIRRLKSDPATVENEIRTRLNYVGRDEVMYVFPEQDTVAQASNPAGAGPHEDQD